uniref:Uncharacterized protein n=1 Tax=Pristionchus pacificus TaxID=54126 RepID=A0A2A6C5C3_PRIPA|eukprot:PDM73306.1 hypothetical protein PRIPAC_40662 [Pristionchus pacificus]
MSVETETLREICITANIPRSNYGKKKSTVGCLKHFSGVCAVMERRSQQSDWSLCSYGKKKSTVGCLNA